MKPTKYPTQRSLTRRQFARSTAMIGAGLTASSWNKVLGANDRVLLGVIGPGRARPIRSAEFSEELRCGSRGSLRNL